MKRTILGIVVGAIVVGAGNSIYDWWTLSSIQGQPPENWLQISLDIPDVGPGQVPTVIAAAEVFRPVAVRTNISPRNVQTGEGVCQGRSSSAFAEPIVLTDITVTVAELAGLEACVWPAGRYSASITFTMTDMATNVQLKPITMEREFEVTR